MTTIILQCKRLFAFVFITLLIASCSSSNDVAQNGLFQKRKYRQGFHFNGLASKADRQKPVTGGTVVLENNVQDQHEIAGGMPVMESREENLETPARQRVKSESLSRKPALVAPVKSHLSQGMNTFRSKKQEIYQSLEESAHGRLDRDTVEEDTDVESAGLLTLLFGIAAWFFALLSVVLPPLGLLGLVCAIIGFILGRKYKDTSAAAKIGYILSLVYLILTIISIILVILFLLIFLIIIIAAV